LPNALALAAYYINDSKEVDPGINPEVSKQMRMPRYKNAGLNHNLKELIKFSEIWES
jgi:hypothetical protein